MKRGRALILLSWAAAVLATLGPAASLASEAPPGERPVPLSYARAVDIALSGATAILKAQNSERDAAARLLQGYAQFLPDLNTSLGASHTTGTSVYAITGLTLLNTKQNNGTFTISSTLNLFNGLGDWGALHAALERRAGADLSLRFARQQIILDTEQTFLQVVLDDQLVEIARHNLDASDARLKLLRGQAAVGQASPADLQRQVAQRTADALALTQAEIRSHDDLLGLLRKLRLDPAVEYRVEGPSLEVRPGPLAGENVDELSRRALDRRLDLQAAGTTAAAADWDIAVARAPYFPSLNLGFTRFANGVYLLSQSVNGVDTTPAAQTGIPAQLGNYVLYQFQLTLSWNIFNRLVDRTHVAQARLAADNARIDAEDTRIRVLADVRQARADFESATRQLQSAHVGSQAALEAYKTIEGRYRVGASSFIDVLAAQSALVAAQQSEAQAAVNLKLQEATLAFAAGELSPPQ